MAGRSWQASYPPISRPVPSASGWNFKWLLHWPAKSIDAGLRDCCRPGLANQSAADTVWHTGLAAMDNHEQGTGYRSALAALQAESQQGLFSHRLSPIVASCVLFPGLSATGVCAGETPAID
jgi:hypothetical protein